MIYITGDTHSDFKKFSTSNFHEQKMMSKEDYIIICGDFGGIWDNGVFGTSKSEAYWLDWLNDRPFTTLFVDGNHENFDMLGNFAISDWNGGEVQHIKDSVIHLMRGQVYDICGKKYFTMGGAQSHDISGGILDANDPAFALKRRQLDRQGASYRINHWSWWKEEMPNDKEYEVAWQNLEANNWKVDYIISHCCPTSVQGIVGGGNFQPDRLTDFFEDVKEKCEYDFWFCGHYHVNRIVMNNHVLLYEKILPIESSEKWTKLL